MLLGKSDDQIARWSRGESSMQNKDKFKNAILKTSNISFLALQILLISQIKILHADLLFFLLFVVIFGVSR